ncbi:MAG: glycine cleavage system aminomethyltransferase GcvT [Candidatus Aminicenantes bacterium]|nr:glycine cleavage system aminomethyltransferase GcvT [Candidatus Aminicenantes bacterium]NIM78514.1 glycine cleavage system aminomethyltransferase GcvT [Candidatus Aminicenantes bacterium]NIN17750.1 glycine cleavage system aminomethyltransferase GcvT [Candidatus Aminicenantes bacterium]NIN41651.1 glycine cleavage system aminomethyltransferase GcvT [Candidatus Aminicenantes bacterium]NIN84400.1 glycine cleavage system aminomethyltransferase GcvT [Candidatus Aminicenantes bacterium]
MKKTKVNKAHYVLKGKMVNFFQWDLPVQYTGINEEHNAVRTTGGIFDVSHMGEIRCKGPQALDAVQYVTANNVAKLNPGRIHYTGLLTEKGCFVDDLLVYMIAENHYFLVVNAANTDKDFGYMKEKTNPFDVEITNESDDYTQVAIQGPKAETLLSAFTDIDLTAITYYHFTFGKVNNIEALISRTGYTGEDGFEVYVQVDEETASGLFLDLVEKGKEHGIVPVGLGARDTLRLEAGMALYGNDIDDSHTVLEADLGWILKLKKGDFLGRDVLLKQKEEGIKRKLVGFELVDRGVARHGYPVYVDGSEYSTVTSGTFAPFLNKPIGMAYLPIEKCEIGTEFEIGIRGKRVKAKVVETPFYKRNK